MQEVRGNIAERVASAFNDRDPRMKRWACMSAERRRQYVLRWERRLQAIRDAGFEVVEVAEVEDLRDKTERLQGLLEDISRDMVEAVVRLTRERDEARAEVERLRAESERLFNEDTKTRHALKGWAFVCPDGGDEPTHERVAAVVAEVERLREALEEWDALIAHQFHGTRDAMSDMQRAALNTKRILDELDALDGPEAKP